MPGVPTSLLWSATYVTGGFIATKVASGFVLPMIGVQQPLFRILSKGVLAWGVGWVGGMMLGRNAGNLLMVGGFVEVIGDAVKTYVSPFVPALAAAEMQEMSDMSAYYQAPQVESYYQVGAGNEQEVL